MPFTNCICFNRLFSKMSLSYFFFQSKEKMSIQEYLEEIQKVQSILLEFLEDEANVEENYQDLCDILKKVIIHDKNKLRLFLHLISSISKNHYDGQDLINRIFQIIEYLEEPIKKYLSNSEIFNSFKNNKRILLFLIDKKMIVFNEEIIRKIIQPKYLEANYHQYFQPEIKPFMNEKWFPKSNKNNSSNEWIKEIEHELPENFEELRKSGKNESYICSLIRNDSVEEFIIHVNRNNISLNSIIRSSIYETNSFLIKKQIESDKSYNNRNSSSNDNDDKLTLIKYATFFGSIQIFKYLQISGVELTPQLWYFAIHSKNAEIIHLMEENHIELENLYEKCFVEAVKCHHNEIAYYFLNNFLQNNEKNTKNAFLQGLKYYNFSFLQNELIIEKSIFYMCQYDYYYFSCLLLKDTNIDVNKILNEPF